jgi:hypothetical protein
MGASAGVDREEELVEHYLWMITDYFITVTQCGQ